MEVFMSNGNGFWIAIFALAIVAAMAVVMTSNSNRYSSNEYSSNEYSSSDYSSSDASNKNYSNSQKSYTVLPQPTSHSPSTTPTTNTKNEGSLSRGNSMDTITNFNGQETRLTKDTLKAPPQDGQVGGLNGFKLD